MVFENRIRLGHELREKYSLERSIRVLFIVMTSFGMEKVVCFFICKNQSTMVSPSCDRHSIDLTTSSESAKSNKVKIEIQI